MLDLEKNKLYIPLGRGLGEFTTSDNQRTFLIANGMKQIELTEFEYIIWQQMSNYETGEKWREAIEKNIPKNKKVNWVKILNKFSIGQIFFSWYFSGIEDPKLVNTYVTRQGYAHGLVEDKWLVSDKIMTRSIILTKDQFDVWNAGAGHTMFLEVIDNLMNQREISLEKALELLVDNGFTLVQLGLWNLEYIDLESEEGTL